MPLFASRPKSSSGMARRRALPTSGTVCFAGIDVGSDEVRVVSMATSRGDKRLRWCTADQFSLTTPGEIASTPEIVDLIAAELQTKLPSCLRGISVETNISLPSSWVHYQSTTPTELPSVLAGCDAMFRASLFQSGMHHKVWSSTATGERLTVAAVAETGTSKIADAVSDAGYKVAGVLPGMIAVENAASALTGTEFRCLLQIDNNACVAVIPGLDEFGQTDHRMLSCRAMRPFPREHSSPGLGDQTPRGLCRPLPTLNSISQWLMQLSIELRGTSRFCGRPFGFGDDDAAPIMICGSYAEIPGIDAALAQHLGVPIATWTYSGDRRPTSIVSDLHGNSKRCQPDNGFRGTDARYATALSLAFSAAVAYEGGDD